MLKLYAAVCRSLDVRNRRYLLVEYFLSEFNSHLLRVLGAPYALPHFDHCLCILVCAHRRQRRCDARKRHQQENCLHVEAVSAMDKHANQAWLTGTGERNTCRSKLISLRPTMIELVRVTRRRGTHNHTEESAEDGYIRGNYERMVEDKMERRVCQRYMKRIRLRAGEEMNRAAWISNVTSQP